MTTTDSANSPAREQLSELFGSYKAEWLQEQLFDLFTEPSYFPALLTPRPCVLIGGRGTGKTTVLRCLSYDGRFHLAGNDVQAIAAWPYYGVYYCANTNRLAALEGPEVSTDVWIKIFAHYFNLELVELILRFVTWYSIRSSVPQLPPSDCRAVATSLCVPPADTIRELLANVTAARIEFEAYINNIHDAARPHLSLQGAPVDLLTSRLAALPQFAGKRFFVLIDEYENFLDYQQQVVNTLIKHARQYYTFKIGVRELGWRVRSTLNANEQLIDPSDYVRIDITDTLAARFDEFATTVCDSRLKRLSGSHAPQSVAHMFASMSDDDEAVQLGVLDRVQELRSELSSASPQELDVFDSLSPLEAYFIDYWARARKQQPLEALRERIASPTSWGTRFDNHRHAALFTIRRGKRGIRKYYAGWRSLVQLAGCNIRYLLELVEKSLALHLDSGRTLTDTIDCRTQTFAAQHVGRKNLTELEGLSVQGAKLTKLLLGLGRVFQVLASQPEGHAPEVNQFHISADDQGGAQEVDQILRHAVMHLALLRYPGSKLQDVADTREYDYAVHPIFAAFFVFSYRRKRKLALSPADILGLIANPKTAIASILTQHGRNEIDALPEQLALFEGFYAGGAE